MHTRAKLLKILMENDIGYHSGEQLGSLLGVSRNAVWKSIQQLRSDGYKIESRPRVGYRLIGGGYNLTKSAIQGHLEHPCQIEVFDTIDSTNNYAMNLSLDDKPALIVANKQTSGRGRLGRDFFSPAGTGVYMTIAMKPNFAIDKALFVTMATAVSVCHAIEDIVPVKARIKWVNDILINQKKVCGILTEAKTNFETGRIDGLVIGIGLNCFPPASMPKDIENSAGVLSRTRNSFSRNELVAKVFNYTMEMVEKIAPEDIVDPAIAIPEIPTISMDTVRLSANATAFLNEYRNRCIILGKHIVVHPVYQGVGLRANAIDIDDNGGLIIEYLEGPKMRQIETLTTGEVSISFE